MNDDHQDARMILALAAEADDRFIWDRIKTLQPEMFAAGPVADQVCLLRRRRCASDVGPTSRRAGSQTLTTWPTSWTGAGLAACAAAMSEISDILEQALQETRQGPVQAVVIVGDHFHGDLDAAVAAAKQLRAAGTRLFLFQQGRSDPTERAFRILAEVTGGAYFPFNPHIERVAERLPGMLEAVTHFVIGGMAALEARDNESAVLLLEQMNAAGQIAQGTPQTDES